LVYELYCNWNIRVRPTTLSDWPSSEFKPLTPVRMTADAPLRTMVRESPAVQSIRHPMQVMLLTCCKN